MAKELVVQAKPFVYNGATTKEEIPMREPKPKSNPADKLLKTTKKKDIELTEKELGKVRGGSGIKGDSPDPKIKYEHGA